MYTNPRQSPRPGPSTPASLYTFMHPAAESAPRKCMHVPAAAKEKLLLFSSIQAGTHSSKGSGAAFSQQHRQVHSREVEGPLFPQHQQLLGYATAKTAHEHQNPQEPHQVKRRGQETPWDQQDLTARESRPGLVLCAASPCHILSTLSIQLGSAQLMMSTACTTMESLKGTDGAKDQKGRNPTPGRKSPEFGGCWEV